MATRIENACEALLEPEHLYAWGELRDDKSLPPAAAGAYAWYFKAIPDGVPTRGCHRSRRLPLLYVGISPGRPGSKSHLRSRIRYHFRGNASGSTLRTSLGCLLGSELRMRLRRTGTGRSIKFTHSGEAQLRTWLSANARVCWVKHSKPWQVEEAMLTSCSLPLNLEGNEGHPFHDELSELRSKCKRWAERHPPVRS